MVEKKQPSEADAALGKLEQKYAKTPWFASHKADINAARAEAKAAVAEGEAEKLYAQAAALFKQNELFDLKPIIEKLKANYPKTRPVTDAERKPSFAEMADATRNLGRFITVRKDGKGDFREIQDAINSAPANSVVEIQDDGTYLVPAPNGVDLLKEGMTLRGKKGCWPILAQGSWISSALVSKPNVTIEHLVISYTFGPGDTNRQALGVAAGPFRVRSAILHTYRWQAIVAKGGTQCEVQGCVIIGSVSALGPASIRDSVCLQMPVETGGSATFQNVVMPSLRANGPSEIRFCTVPGSISLAQEPNLILDSILGRVESAKEGSRVERCDVLAGKAGYRGFAKPGSGCFSADPQFRDPENFDYRLKPTSPCRKKASDGGDIGCRFTAEMLEVLEKAIELRKKGIIKF